jgi:hypothetical protein
MESSDDIGNKSLYHYQETLSLFYSTKNCFK